jgi:hypothetical protein
VHLHLVQATAQPAAGDDAGGNVLAQAGQNLTRSFASAVAMGGQSVTPVGGSQPHDDMMPYLVLNFIIALRASSPPATDRRPTPVAPPYVGEIRMFAGVAEGPRTRSGGAAGIAPRAGPRMGGISPTPLYGMSPYLPLDIPPHLAAHCAPCCRGNGRPPPCPP